MSFEMQKLMEFIGKPVNVNTYLHNTQARGTADDIMRDGFWFEDGGLVKTTDMITDTESYIEMNWWNAQRGQYGLYTVVVQIARPLMAKYGSGALLPEEMLSKDRFYSEDAEELMYILQPEYVKGHFNRDTNEGYLNPRFNPSYDNPELAALNAARFLEGGPGIMTQKF
jgi:hypothetical protein